MKADITLRVFLKSAILMAIGLVSGSGRSGEGIRRSSEVILYTPGKIRALIGETGSSVDGWTQTKFQIIRLAGTPKTYRVEREWVKSRKSNGRTV